MFCVCFCLCRVHVKRRRLWREYCSSMGMRACGMCSAKSWRVRAIRSVERTMIMRGSRLPSPGAWPCPRGRFSISSSCDGERSRAGSAYAVTVKTDSGKSYSRHHARIGCVDKKWLSTGGIADNACLSEREHVEHPSFLCHGLPVPKTVCPHKAKTGRGSACHAYPLGTHGTPACRHGWCGMFRYTATMRRG